MISQLRLTNFKCFKDLDLPIAMFTLLAGLNGMGKSSVMQSILLLRQSWRSGDFKNGRLALNGDLTQLGTGYDVLFEGADTDEIRISVDLFTKSDESQFLNKSEDFWYSYEKQSDRLTRVSPNASVNSVIKDLLKITKVDTMQALFDDARSRQIANNLAASDPVLTKVIAKFNAQSEWLRAAERERVSPFSNQFHYIFSERFGPRKMLPLSESHVRDEDMGLNGEYVLHFLLEYGKKISLAEGDPRLLNADEFGHSLEGQVDAWLQEISPGSHLSTEPIQRGDSVLTGFAFDRPGDVKTRAFRATNVGFGLSYVLPVLVALLSSKKGALILLENPEAHMHPRGQTRLGQLAARTAAAGIQVIVETHSDHVMDGVRIDIREGGGNRLAAGNAVFHYFERDNSGVKVTTPKITDDGRLDNWPLGFFDQHDENLIKLLAPRKKVNADA